MWMVPRRCASHVPILNLLWRKIWSFQSFMQLRHQMHLHQNEWRGPGPAAITSSPWDHTCTPHTQESTVSPPPTSVFPLSTWGYRLEQHLLLQQCRALLGRSRSSHERHLDISLSATHAVPVGPLLSLPARGSKHYSIVRVDSPPNSGNSDSFGSFSAGASSDNLFAAAMIILSVIFLASARIVPSPRPG